MSSPSSQTMIHGVVEAWAMSSVTLGLDAVYASEVRVHDLVGVGTFTDAYGAALSWHRARSYGALCL